MAKPRPKAQPEREYTDDVSYLAWSQARFYPGTTHAAWEAYLRGHGQRPVAWGAALTPPARTTVTRWYAGVLVTETADGWLTENVVSRVDGLQEAA